MWLALYDGRLSLVVQMFSFQKLNMTLTKFVMNSKHLMTIIAVMIVVFAEGVGGA